MLYCAEQELCGTFCGQVNFDTQILIALNHVYHTCIIDVTFTLIKEKLSKWSLYGFLTHIHRMVVCLLVT